MALDTAPARIARQRGSSAPLRGRGRPQMVTERTTNAVARLIEGQAFAQEVIGAASAIATAAAIGSRHLIVHEAGRLGVRAQAYRAELRRLAGELES